MYGLQTFGQVEPILIDDQNRVIVGHVVWEAMRRLGADTIRCIEVTHLDEQMRRAYAITTNRLGELGDWVLDDLRAELVELQQLEIKLDVTGFSVPELDIILTQPDGRGDTDAEIEIVEDEAEVVTRTGDLFALGPHLVLCGDALQPDSYERLMGAERAAGVFSDPPYNCKIDGHVSGLGKNKHKDFAMAVGEMSREEFGDFLKAYLAHCRTWSSAGAVIFACMDWRQIDVLYAAGRAAGLSLINKAIWSKGGGMGSLYRSAYEEVAVFCTADTPAVNNVMLGKHGRDRINVWEYPGANRQGSSSAKALASHPTPKPVELVSDAIMDVTNRGEIVLDPFLGSGSTLIACENTGRVGRFIELDPKYVDAAIRRWQKQSGGSAVLTQTGQTYSSLSSGRSMNERDEAAEDGVGNTEGGPKVRIAGLIEGPKRVD